MSGSLADRMQPGLARDMHSSAGSVLPHGHPLPSYLRLLLQGGKLDDITVVMGMVTSS